MPQIPPFLLAKSLQVPPPANVAPTASNQSASLAPDAANDTLVFVVAITNTPYPTTLTPTFTSGNDDDIFRIVFEGGQVRGYVDDNTNLPAADGTTIPLGVRIANGIAPPADITISVEVAAPALSFVQNYQIAEFAGASSPGYFRVPIWCAKGDVPAGNGLVLKIGDTTLRAQFDNRVYWSDGSLKGCVARVDYGSFTASQEKTVSVFADPDNDFDNTTTGTVADIADEIDFAFSSLTQYDGSTTATRASGAALASFQTHAAVPTRVTRFAGGPVCDGFKVWGMAADGADGSGAADAHLKLNTYVERWKDEEGAEFDVEFAGVPAQDWWSIPNKYRLNYTLALKLNGSTIQTYSGCQHPYRSRMRTVYMGDDPGHGRRHWKNARPTLYYKPDRTYWIAAGIAPPYDVDIALTSGAARGFARTYVPFAGMSHRTAMAGSGPYEGRGMWSTFDTLAFIRQDADDLRIARTNDHAGMHIPYHYMSNNQRTRSGESADIANTIQTLPMLPKSAGEYDFTADGMPAAVNAYSGSGTGASFMDNYVAPSGGNGVWTQLELSNAHTPNFCEFMYLMEGDEEWLDELLCASNGGMQRNRGNDGGSMPRALGHSDTAYRAALSVPGTQWGAIAIYPTQPRAMAWSALMLGAAGGLIPAAHESAGYFAALVAHNGEWIAQSIETPYLPQSGLDAGIMARNSNAIFASWEIHFQAFCFWRAWQMTEDANLRLAAETATKHAAGIASSGRFYCTNYRNMFRPRASVWVPDTAEFFAPGEHRFAVAATIAAATNRITLSLSGHTGTWGLPITNGDTVYFSTVGIDTSFTVIPLPTGIVEGQLYYIGDVSGSTCKLYTDAELTTEFDFVADVATAVLGLRLQTDDDYPVATNPPAIPPVDYWPMHGHTAMVVANQCGSEVATDELVDAYTAFVAPIDRNPFPNWALKRL